MGESEAADRSPGDIEELIARFIEERDTGAGSDPVAFAAEHAPGDPRLLQALRSLVDTEALFPDETLDLPTRVGRYRVLDEVGRGGMGRVLRVQEFDEPESEVRALKLLHDSLQHHPRALERFRREGEALGRVRHPGVVRQFDTGLDRGRPFLVMELVEGTSLATPIASARRNGSSTVDLPGEGAPSLCAARLVAQVARAIQAAHNEGVLHRDLNPRNILLRPDGSPVVVDFGLVHAEGSDTLTVTGDVVGTPQYMAPEQALGQRVDGRVDVFGLGAILFELLALRPPREADETFALLREASTRPVRDPRRAAPDAPPLLARIIRRATAFDPNWRYPTPGDLAFDLEAFVDGRPLTVAGPGIRQRVRETWMLHRRGLLLSAAVLGVGGMAGGFWLGGALSEPEVTAEMVATVRNQMLVAWLDEEWEEARVSFAQLRQYVPEERMLPYYEALVNQRELTASEDPMVQAVIDGEAYRREGRAAEARKMYDIAWKFEPNTVLLPVLSGLAVLADGDGEMAKTAFQAVIMPLFASTRMHLHLSNAFEAAGSTPDVVLARETAKVTAPENLEVAFELARAYAANDEPEKAAEEATRARSLAPDRWQESVEQRASELEASGRPEAASQLRALFEQ